MWGRGCQIESWEQMFKLEPFSLQSDSPRQGVRVEVGEKTWLVEQLGLCACPQGWVHAHSWACVRVHRAGLVLTVGSVCVRVHRAGLVLTHSPLAGIY